MDEGQHMGREEELAAQGLEEISLSNDNEYWNVNEGSDVSESDIEEGETVGQGYGDRGFMLDDQYALNCVEDFDKINLLELRSENIMRYHFPDVSVAYMFYNWYASMHGFAARKSKILWNSNREMIQQTFLCHRQGERAEKHFNRLIKKREPKKVTRCGCQASCKVHVNGSRGRWYIKYFNDEHNHGPMNDKYTCMLPAHRKMSEHDISQMNRMREVGIRTTHIYGHFARLAGGYENIRFTIRDMYNEQRTERKSEFTDAQVAVDYLEGLRKKDEMMFWRHTVDENGRLEHLFWCDGVGRKDFSVFGDVLAFDATYRKNKYLCPLVVFSGVNHHNMSIVFASCIVGNESEETYVWVLTQFLEAMGGKTPVSVITDGDLAMRNAIRKVFPDSHHRLCAWHLIRNATSNVKNPKFVSKFKQCMLGDIDVGEFNSKWVKLVQDFGLQQNNWIKEMYEKRKMWAAAFVRGNFFAGFRTTSRCEGLHSEFGKYVNSHNNLSDFLQHYFRWLSYMRHREIEADYSSLLGEPVIQTQLEDLERSAASVYTTEIFMLFRPVLNRACTCRVVGVGKTRSLFIYGVSRYRKEGVQWRVTFCQSSLQFKCSCERFESLGIPCEHLVCVMVYLNIVRLPECVVLKRWTKAAKDSIGVLHENPTASHDPALWCHYTALVDYSKDMAKEAYELGMLEYMRKSIEMVRRHTEELKALRTGENVTRREVDPLIEGSLRNPVRARTKGCGGSSSQQKGKKTGRKRPKCRVCGEEGHNRQSCQIQRQIEQQSQLDADIDDADEEDNLECDFANIDMNVA